MAVVCAAVLIAPSSMACSLAPAFHDGGRYVGGDLAAQIADRANTIQLVRAVHRMPIGEERGGSLGSGRSEVVFAFQFHVIETLAHRESGREPRIPGAFSLDAFERRYSRPTPDGYRTIDEVEVWLIPDALDRPGSQQGYSQLSAPTPVRLSGGSCGWPMRVALGEEFVVLRDSSGDLYGFDHIGAAKQTQSSEPLLIDFAYSPERRTIDRRGAPPLIRVEGRADPAYVRIRAALAANNRLRER